MIMTIMSLWLVRIPISAILSKYFGTACIWWGIPIALIMGLIGKWIYYLTGRWKRKLIVREFSEIETNVDEMLLEEGPFA